MHNYKTQEFIDSLQPAPGFLLIRILPDDSITTLILIEQPRQPYEAIIVKTGGEQYMLSNGTYVNSLRKVGEHIIIDPASYSAHLSFHVEGNTNELPTIYRLIPEYIVVCSINKL